MNFAFHHSHQFVEKSVFSKKCLFSIPIPFRTLCGLCFVQSSVCPYFGILAENPFPLVKGCVCLVGSASCRAFWHTRPASVPGLSVGLPPSPRLGLHPKPHFLRLCSFFNNLTAVMNFTFHHSRIFMSSD